MSTALGRDQYPASESSADGFEPSASAIRPRLSMVRLRSPRSMRPMCDRSIPAASAIASCENPWLFRAARIALPSAASTPFSLDLPETLTTIQHLADRACEATAFTTRNPFATDLLPSRLGE